MGNSTLQKQEGYSTSNHRLMLFNTITIEKGVYKLTLIFAHASCVDSVPRNSFTSIEPKY